MATPSVPAGFKLVPDSLAQSTVPEAKGKAAAFDTWLAQGGLLPGKESMGRGGRTPGVFTKGPMKGMSYDQAKQKFEGMWATAPDTIKEKYAGRRETDLAPSERKVAGTTPSRLLSGNAALNSLSPMEAQKRRMAGYGYEMRDGQAEKIGTPAYDKDGNGVPDMIQRPADAAASTPSPTAAARPKFDRRGGVSPTAIAGRSTTGASPSAQTVVTPPAPIMPTTPAYTGGRSDLSPLAQRELANRKAAVDATPTGRPVVASPAAGINRLTGLPFGYQPGDTQTPGAPVIDPKLAAQSAKRQEVATSQAAIEPPKTLIPGITPKPQPTALSQSQINRPRVLPPNTNTVEGRQGAALERFKQMETNPNPVNPPGLRLTGPKRPLDELVKRQKLQGIGTPARQ